MPIPFEPVPDRPNQNNWDFLSRLFPLGPANGGLPIGALLPYAGAAAPTGYLLCDGTAVSRTTYARLFAVLSTTYGAGDGSTTFNLPDLRGRVPVGVDGAAGRLSSNDALGNSAGTQTHTLTTPEIPAHTHGIGYNLANVGGGLNGTPDAANTFTYQSQSTGGGGAHNNMQPYQVVNYIVKA